MSEMQKTIYLKKKVESKSGIVADCWALNGVTFLQPNGNVIVTGKLCLYKNAKATYTGKEPLDTCTFKYSYLASDDTDIEGLSPTQGVIVLLYNKMKESVKVHSSTGQEIEKNVLIYGNSYLGFQDSEIVIE